ncbi:MAG: alpha/beta hydrolase [Desulfobacteraceae bacterium]|jgi:alpha-beta hydrolase superfamily lysophospholipase|nr:MAG: alpha/beta hydrolase [Desulfobacteraceae bacterium]
MIIPDNLSPLDHPEVISLLFYPRRDSGQPLPQHVTRIDIATADGLRLDNRLYPAAPEKPHILFFHGNGEIAEDYDDIGRIYTQSGMSFVVVDYRGYGASQGMPGVTSMLADAHAAINRINDWMAVEKRTGPLWVMGRSLGSAPAIELAYACPEKMSGLIIESGFSQTMPLLRRLGINVDRLNIPDNKVFSNADKIAAYTGPTLIIHAQYDQIIPIDHGRELFARSPATTKKMHVIPDADHNTLLMMAGMDYFHIIRNFIASAGIHA